MRKRDLPFLITAEREGKKAAGAENRSSTGHLCAPVRASFKFIATVALSDPVPPSLPHNTCCCCSSPRRPWLQLGRTHEKGREGKGGVDLKRGVLSPSLSVWHSTGWLIPTYPELIGSLKLGDVKVNDHQKSAAPKPKHFLT